MLRNHMDAREGHLVAISQVPANAGHSLHKGTPREAFVREFLETHLPSNVSIGTGEIIDAYSQPGQQRNQFDIVIYKRSYPKLDFGGGVSGFLIESVVATIEVKSNLTPGEFRNAAKASRTTKLLTPHTTAGFVAGSAPPKILNYIVSYDGPANMQTVYKWINPEYQKLGIAQTQLPADENRVKTAADAIDAVFVLKRGFLYYDNTTIGFSSPQSRQQNPGANWVFADTSSGNLLLLFLLLQAASANIDGRWLNSVAYLSSFSVSGVQFGS